MSDPIAPGEATPRTDQATFSYERYVPAMDWVSVNFARQLERELADLKHDIERHLAICSEQAMHIAELEEKLAAISAGKPTE